MDVGSSSTVTLSMAQLGVSSPVPMRTSMLSDDGDALCMDEGVALGPRLSASTLDLQLPCLV